MENRWSVHSILANIVSKYTLSSEQLSDILPQNYWHGKTHKVRFAFFAFVKMVRMAYSPSVGRPKGQSQKNFLSPDYFHE